MDLLDWYSIQKYIYAHDDLNILKEQYAQRKEEIISDAYPKWDMNVGGYYKSSTEEIAIDLVSLENNYKKQAKRITRNTDIFHRALSKLDDEQRRIVLEVLEDNRTLLDDIKGKRARETISDLASVIQSIKDGHIHRCKEERKQELLKQLSS